MMNTVSVLNETTGMDPISTSSESPSLPEHDSGVFWYDDLSSSELAMLVYLPCGTLLLLVILLRLVWRPRSGPKFKLPVSTAAFGTYGSVETSDHSNDQKKHHEAQDWIASGEVAGAYDEDWKGTFDFVFVMGMAVLFIALLVLTAYIDPELWINAEFWLFLIPKFVGMIVVSTMGGLLCRVFCTTNDNGYIMTTRSSTFKVNYTRKLQYFAAYLIPLVIKPPSNCNCFGALALAWGDFVTMLAFLLMIKPLRERYSFFMLQFNSLDRPEDRPHTLKWTIAGNILPGMALLIFFRWLFDQTTQPNLVLIVIFITVIGDGLAEPVGILFGKHKYSTSSCFSSRKYSRSWEGSACVFLSGMAFPAIFYQEFQSPEQLLATMLILPPLVAYAEATAPHTMDTPVLMIVTGLVLCGIIHML